MDNQKCILILGGGGFVGSHLRSLLNSKFGKNARIIATSLNPKDSQTMTLDIRDTETVRKIVLKENPTHIVNLVGIAAPLQARQNPNLAWELHALAPERLGRMLLQEAPSCWLLHVSSGLVYGKTALTGNKINEVDILQPIDTYAVTKAAGDLAMGVLAYEGLKCIRLRPFNHIGPGQSEDFAVSAFAAQIIRIKVGLQQPLMKVGNLSAFRDFLDVRDVVNAYCTLIEKSDNISPGSIYNIASGLERNMNYILQRLINISRLSIQIQDDPERIRPSDLNFIIGNSEQLKNDTGWAPIINLEATLVDILKDQEKMIKNTS